MEGFKTFAICLAFFVGFTVIYWANVNHPTLGAFLLGWVFAWWIRGYWEEHRNDYKATPR